MLPQIPPITPSLRGHVAQPHLSSASQTKWKKQAENTTCWHIAVCFELPNGCKSYALEKNLGWFEVAMSVKSARPHPPRHSHRHGHTDRDGRQCMPTNDHFETSDDGCFANRESPRPSTSTNIFDKYLEDHPRTCKWVITMVSCRKSPKRGFWDPFQMAVSWLINGVDPNYLVHGSYSAVSN